VLNSLLDEYFAKTTVSTGSQLDYVHELPWENGAVQYKNGLWFWFNRTLII